MSKNKAIDRLAFLSKKFNIFNLKNDYTETDLNEITSHDNFKTINGHNDNILALRCVSKIKKLNQMVLKLSKLNHIFIYLIMCLI